MKDTQFHFIHKGIPYFFLGEVNDYFYDFNLNPLINKTNLNSLDKAKLLYGLWENFNYFEINSENSNSLYESLTNYFSQYGSHELGYWSLLNYETIEKYDTTSCNYNIDQSNGNLILENNEVKIFMPKPYTNLLSEDLNGNICEVDETNILDFSLLNFNQGPNQLLFTSENQDILNQKKLDTWYSQIILLLRNTEIEISTWEELARYHSKLS